MRPMLGDKLKRAVGSNGDVLLDVPCIVQGVVGSERAVSQVVDDQRKLPTVPRAPVSPDVDSLVGILGEREVGEQQRRNANRPRWQG